MITITEASATDFDTISNIARKTWPITYGSVISKAQIEYMLDLFYSTESLEKNIQDRHNFLLAKESGIAIGFASFVHDFPEKGVTKIPKIYLLPETQGKGIGKMLIDKITALAKAHGSTALTLNVNRYNKALGFYEKIGFGIAGQEDIKLEHGYLMEDFIMKKPI